ncbi:MAG: DNA helicase RecQ [Eubacteriales bacterium]
MDEKHRVLKQYYGYDSFRGGQEALIDALLSGRDVLGVMPTGAGKSMCYQIPALLLEGITIVVSPLISLMSDQVTMLVDAGVPAAYLNSSLTPGQCTTVLNRLRGGWYKLIYVAPERLMTPAFLSVCETLNISLVAVDEAHCVSQWGQDFRPGYLKIAAFIETLSAKKRPVIGAFTATATEAVRKDIVRLLALHTPYSMTTGFDRPNLYFGVIQPENKNDTLLSLIAAQEGRSGIVYCATRKSVEEVCSVLCENGYDATRYHAGLSEEERRLNQRAFVYDEKHVMVATNAFGMGIDKSDVSYVIHYQMPMDPESYYQEAGRAGRDGSPASCILLFSPQDIRTAKYLIENGEPNPELDAETQAFIRDRAYTRLRAMTAYCRADRCLRTMMLRYFGEPAQNDCGNCSVCRTKQQWNECDCTEDALKILSCIVRMGQRYGRKAVADVLRGKTDEKYGNTAFQNLPTYGIMRGRKPEDIRRIIVGLCDAGYLVTEGDMYPILHLTEKGRAFLYGRGEDAARFSMRMPDSEQKHAVAVPTGSRNKKKKTERKTESAGIPDTPLMQALRVLRTSFAMKAKIPAYVVFPDATLAVMCEKKPRTIEELLLLPGVGQAKAQKYGAAFLRVIAHYRDN